MADEEKIDELELTEIEDDAQSEMPTENEGVDSVNDGEEFVKKDKNSLIKKILMAVVGLLILILILGVVLYFMGVFDPEEKPMPKTDEKITKVDNTQKEEKKRYQFNINDINSKKLNKQLEMLTNKNIKEDEAIKKSEELEKIENEKKILEEEKQKREEELALEEERISEEKALLEAKKKELENEKNELEILKQEALLLKEQMMKDKEALENEQIMKEAEALINQEKEILENEDTSKNNTKTIQTKITTNNEMHTNTENEDNNKFLLLINIAKIKGNLYKNYLDKVVNINPDVLLCRDDKNRIEMYYGPFESNEIRSNLFNQLQQNGFNDSYEVELTKDEFDKRCKY